MIARHTVMTAAQTATLFLGLVICGRSLAQDGDPDPDDYAPGQWVLTPAIDLQLRPTELTISKDQYHTEELTLQLPPGFTASLFAVGFSNPRFMAVSPDGVLHLSDMARGEIIALPDRDDDGFADEAVVVADGFVEANSPTFYQGNL